MIKCLVGRAALYAAETWTLMKRQKKIRSLSQCGYGEEWKRSM